MSSQHQLGPLVAGRSSPRAWTCVLGVAALAVVACGGSIGDGLSSEGGETGREGAAAGGSNAPGTAGASSPNAPGAPAGATGPSAGAAPLRRLTRDQFNNAVRDLLGIKENVAAELPPDEAGGGFVSNPLAPVTELHVDKYAAVAESLARRAVANLATIVPCDPKANEPACTQRFIESFGRRAYRRPLTATEVDRYKRLFAAARAQSDFTGGVRLVIQAMLQSLHFLYRFELAPAAMAGRIVPLDAWAVASRLSFFLWNSVPDEALLDAAAGGKLATLEQVTAQAMRLIADARFRDTVASFHGQWLDLGALESRDKNTKVYPAWNETLRAAMRDETARFVDYVLREGDGRLDTLLSARFTFATGPLFELYGLGSTTTAPLGTWKRADLDPKQRAGLLTHASLLATHAHADQTSPVHRGIHIRQRILCLPLPPPPPDVNNTPPPPDPNQTTRERFEAHRADPGCAACHRLIDPLGVAFETYDGIGRFRTTDGRKPVDARGDIFGTEALDGPVANGVALVEKLAAAEEVRACVAKQWLRFALGREEAPEEAASVAAALKAFSDSGQRIPDLLLALARSDAFRYQKVRP